jgi:hypothetical protein
MWNIVSVLGAIHDRPFAAASRVQNIAVQAGLQMVLFTDQAFEAFDGATRQLPGVERPWRAVVGRRGELGVLLRKNARQWAELQRDYQTAIIEALLRNDQVSVPLPSAALKDDFALKAEK